MLVFHIFRLYLVFFYFHLILDFYAFDSSFLENFFRFLSINVLYLLIPYFVKKYSIY